MNATGVIPKISIRALVLVIASATALQNASASVTSASLSEASASAESSKTDESKSLKSLKAAVAADTRSQSHRARDKFRHPVETLSFFGVESSDTIIELWPGRGWYTEILAPFANAGGGTLYAAGGWERGLKAIREKQKMAPDIYGSLKLAEFPNAGNHPKVPDESADVVLTFRNVHNWRFGGTSVARGAFEQIYAMLKPHGILGVVDHRLGEDDDAAKEEKSGYMKESTIISYAEAAGFKLVGRSEVNANSKDTKDYTGGVWTLPPRLRKGDEDRAKYKAIGESDRMTLKFMKPGSPAAQD